MGLPGEAAVARGLPMPGLGEHPGVARAEHAFSVWRMRIRGVRHRRLLLQSTRLAVLREALLPPIPASSRRQSRSLRGFHQACLRLAWPKAQLVGVTQVKVIPH